MLGKNLFKIKVIFSKYLANVLRIYLYNKALHSYVYICIFVYKYIYVMYIYMYVVYIYVYYICIC